MKTDNNTTKRSGFTLLEILVAVTIIAILATIVGVKVANEPGRARTAKAKAYIASLSTALRMYRMDNSLYPTMQQGLDALCNKPTIKPIPQKYRPEGYLESSSIPLDPWQHEYVYIIPGPDRRPFNIISYGSDGEPGGEGEAADISSSTLE
jgi:general secretion pathway protein G